MKSDDIRSSRRAFFLRGGTVLGAGVASAAGAAMAAPPAHGQADDELARLRDAVVRAEDREAIRALHERFLSGMAARDYAAVVGSFTDDATLALSGVEARGRATIDRLLQVDYRRQHVATLHAGYRHCTTPAEDRLAFDADRRHARATLAAEADLCTPLRDSSTAAQMARLQGNVAERRWAPGAFEVRYRKTAGGWRIADLAWRSRATA